MLSVRDACNINQVGSRGMLHPLGESFPLLVQVPRDLVDVVTAIETVDLHDLFRTASVVGVLVGAPLWVACRRLCLRLPLDMPAVEAGQPNHVGIRPHT